MNASTICILLCIHFVADFVLQNDWMAINKSKSILALSTHCTVYSACFLVYCSPQFTAINFLLHMGVDAITSNITSYLYQKGQRHWFFVVIGLDQLIHQLTLIYTYQLLH